MFHPSMVIGKTGRDDRRTPPISSSISAIFELSSNVMVARALVAHARVV